jgi:beta-glucosidase
MNKQTKVLLCGLLLSSQLNYAHKAVVNKLPATDSSKCDCDVDKQIALANKRKAVKQSPGLPSKINKNADQTVPKYLDPKVPIEDRITDLLPRLTLEEKVNQLVDSWGSKGIARLKIPAMLKTEGLHGQSYSTGATIFPMPIAMATTFDPDLINKIGKATAIESKAANLRSSWSPVLDVARDARWGRVEETYGEDPYLVSRMGVAWINGFQGEGMIAVPKHFAGHGEPRGGRDSQDEGLSDRVMRNIHLVPFRAAVKEAHVGGVMAAYSTWNGVPDNGSTELLQKILREEWGFDGYVVSDCSGPENFFRKQSTVNNLEEASRQAIRAGVDIECGSVYSKSLASAVNKGYLNESELNNNLRRVFRAKFKLGLFEKPSTDQMIWDKLPAYDSPEHRALAREVSVEGSVLLKNDKNLLPLKKDINTIAVIGPDADVGQTGDYTSKLSPNQVVTVLQGIKSHVSASTKVLYAQGCDVLSQDSTGFAAAVAIAKQANVVVMVVGDQSTRENVKGSSKPTTGENVDGATLEIPGVQRQLIKAIQATGKPVVLVLVNGKPFTLPWEAEHIPALLETWYPGEEGGNATADLLFGDRNPSGKLPITFPRHVGQLPLNYNYEPSGRNYDYYDMPFTPLFRFGYGLSYTTFKYSNLVATPKKDDPGFVTVTADVENTGDRDGDEVAQLYVTDEVTSVNTPVMQLEGAKRVSLKKGEKKTVTFQLTPYQLSILNAGMDRVLESGKFRVHVGGASPEPPTGNTFHKQRIGFTNAAQGVSTEFEVNRNYQADFDYSLTLPANTRGGESFPATVTVKNKGNLIDIADIKLYGDVLLDTHRFEIEPGETKTFTFNIALYKSGQQNVSAVIGQKIIAKTTLVSKAPAKLLLSHATTVVGTDGALHYTALATNSGSEPYKGAINIQSEGKLVASEALDLAPGAHHDVNINYTFPQSGTFLVKVGDNAPQQLVVPGGIRLALKDPLLYLDFDNTANADVINQVTGNKLTVQGAPQFTDGKNGKAFTTGDKKTFINAGNLDLYRKSFTLAAWVKVDALEKNQATFFGGQAPMGADVDVTGTSLMAGIQDQSLSLSFQDRDLKGGAKPATGKWVHVAYTYDAENEQGSVYLNGKLDKSGNQKSYAGPLEMIGAAPRGYHGKFSMDEVLVTRSVLEPNVIKELAGNGIKALNKGDLATDWRTITSPITKLQTWCEIPDNSSITAIVEIADQNNKVINSKTISLKPGAQNYVLDGLNGKSVRLKLQLAASKLGALPVVQTAVLSGSGDTLRWSTSDEWQKGTASNGLKIGR